MEVEKGTRDPSLPHLVENYFNSRQSPPETSISLFSKIPTTFCVPLSPPSSHRHELPPLVENYSGLAVNYVACVTTPQNTTHFHYMYIYIYTSSPSESASPSVPCWPPPHTPLLTSFAPQPSLSAGFCDICTFAIHLTYLDL